MVKVFFNHKESDRKSLDSLLKKNGGKKVNYYDLFLKDLFIVDRPRLYKKKATQEFFNFKREFLQKELQNSGIWIYYPWLKTAYLCPVEKYYHQVLTARNRTLISDVDQKKFYGLKVGVVGLSVGQNAVLTMVRSGGAKNLKIADPDTIEPTNLNRLQTGLPSVGEKKIDEVAKKIYEINPFVNLKLYPEGVNKKNIDDFFTDSFKLDLIVDACDDFEIKHELRKKARDLKIPLVMATDVGEAMLIEVERYDKGNKQKPFGGRLDEYFGSKDFMKMAIAAISPEYFPIAVQDALFEIGKSIPTHPQLGSNAAFCGVGINYVARAIATGKALPEGRVFIDLDDFFDLSHKEVSYKKTKKEREQSLKKLLRLKNVD